MNIALYLYQASGAIGTIILCDSQLFQEDSEVVFGWENSPLLFVVTLAFCFLASEFVMRMKIVKGFG